MDERRKYINEYYNDLCVEDERLTTKHGNVEFIITTNYIDKYLKEGDKILEVGAGTGRYSLHYADKGYDVTSIEYVENNLNLLKSKINSNMKIIAEQGDAIDLSRFDDNSFDITLILGPLYHLYTDQDINKAIDEAIRVTKKNGKIFIAFLTNDSIVLSWILKKHNFDKKGYSFDENFTMKRHPNEYFSAFYIDEFENIMKNKLVDKLHLVATDGMSHQFKEIVDTLDDWEYSEWLRFCLLTCERYDLQGYSNHLLYICNKK